MKKIAKDKQRWLSKRALKTWQQKLSRQKIPSTRGPRGPVRPGQIIKLPKTLSVYDDWGLQLTRAIRSIAERVLNSKSTVTLDCSEITRIAPHGAILLIAELDRLITSSDLIKPIKIIPPQNKRCRQVFKQLGIPDLSKDEVNVTPDRDDVIYWRCTKGSDQSGDGPGHLLERIADKANAIAEKSLVLADLWPGISEAIINTTEHAYSEPARRFPPQHPTTKWWLLTSLRESGFAAAVCDLGIGYRRTTPRTVPERFIARMRNVLQSKNLDAQAIELAMEYGRSRTGQHERGKGSRDALSVLSRHGSGELVIISNTGLVRYEFQANMSMPTIEVSSLKANINATLVWWRLPFQEV